MRALVMVVLMALAGCASPYRQALESRHVERPFPPVTAADQRALAPYNNSVLFPN